MTGPFPGETDLIAQAARALAHGPCAVAVSGGSDSLALLHLLARAAQAQGGALQAVTVDHRLRAGSGDEARFVEKTCAGLNIPHTTLVWDHGPVTGNLMQAARNARRDLMATWAQAQGITGIALGHTADDQAEGFILELSRKAGLEGLSGMRAEAFHQGIVWHRPLLIQHRARLRDWLRHIGQPWVDDPSNDNDAFARVRVRKVLAQLQPLGVGVEEIAASVGNLSAAQAELTAHLHRFISDHVTERAGMLELHHDTLARQPAGLVRRFLRHGLLWIAPAPHAPRGPALDRLAKAALEGRSATLAGVRLRLSGAFLRLTREPRAVQGPVPFGQIWDGRWRVEGPPVAAEIAALGAQGLALRPGWRDSGLPRDALIVSPALWSGPRLIAAPMLDCREYCATIRPALHEFGITH